MIKEHDSCGIVAVIEKNGVATHENIKKNIEALIKLNHRSGFINGEGDGTGILTDIPKKLWEKKFNDNGLEPELVYSPLFLVGHIFIDTKVKSLNNTLIEIKEKFKKHNINILLEEKNQVNSSKLGPNGKKLEPFFLQIAGIFADTPTNISQKLFLLNIDIEENLDVHVVSLSNYSVIYKVMGSADILYEYYLDLQNPLCKSINTIGHNRYSTNTLSHSFRVQPFSLLGHNGEINTIARLRDEAKMLDIPLVYNGSDSQDLNRIIQGIIAHYGFSLFTTMEMIFPPIYNEIHNISSNLKDLYTFLRHLWGPFAQGPAGIVSRFGNQSIFCVDALGLRPLWMVETKDNLYFSSEQGIVYSYEMVNEPKPLAPGEKIGVTFNHDESIKVSNYSEIQQIVYNEIDKNFPLKKYRKKLQVPDFQKTDLIFSEYEEISNGVYQSFGWEREHIINVEKMAVSGKEQITSLGYDGPLAILSKGRINLSDFFKETVAVVTNPAIDREREIEHFSTRMILGGREKFVPHNRGDTSFEILSPILLEGITAQIFAEEIGTTTLDKAFHCFFSENRRSVATLDLAFSQKQTIKERLVILNNEAIQAVKSGAKLIILDDQILFENNEYLWLDPHLAIASIDTALKNENINNENLRRMTSIILRSGSLRHLHDMITAIGLGADAVSPYLLFNSISQKNNIDSIKNVYSALNKGLEKVISTLGIHELRGYSRLFSSIGLHQEIIEILRVNNFFGNNKIGYSFFQLENDALKRREDFNSDKVRVTRSFKLLPKITKDLHDISFGIKGYDVYKENLSEQEKENPLAIRHLLDFKFSQEIINKDYINIGIGNHALPFVISSMSFGSQSETAFRAYAEASYQLNMLSISGEGGEIKSLLGRYPNNRGMQIASGRFGVNVEFVNSSHWLEIKIGQGAKPGEGGHLPSNKVTVKIADARNTSPNTDLISPSNNHDIYSIEDLAQIISELKTTNNTAKIIVKVPIVPNIGTISVGIAKAGADVISLSGYDGGTGAARVHAVQHVGLPIEIGINLSHLALIDAGLRDAVEIWADGGIRSGKDVVKSILLGANRVGFGTLALVAVGCTTCRSCHLDTCHVGISTQIDNIEQATNKGLKNFKPRDFDLSVSNLKRLFLLIAEETKEIVNRLGASTLQDLVGKSDLLQQINYNNLLDLSSLLISSPIQRKSESISNNVISDNATQPEELTQKLVNCTNRMIGSDISGNRVRNNLNGKYHSKQPINIKFKDGSIPGNGLAAYLSDGVNIEVNGGCQDGLGKTAYGGKVSIIKTKDKNGYYINGSIGKSCFYGAQKGLFIVQGNADSRACIRLSGADIIIGGEITTPIQDKLGGIATRANIKGFAFEYMTNGRVIVLGDPGPWICSGMTGGVIYQRIVPELGLDINALKRRIAKGANISILPIDSKGIDDINELLNLYIQELTKFNQHENAKKLVNILSDVKSHFVQIIAKI